MTRDLTTKEISEHLGIHQSTVANWVARGALKGYKDNLGLYRVKEEDWLFFKSYKDTFLRRNTTKEDLLTMEQQLDLWKSRYKELKGSYIAVVTSIIEMKRQKLHEAK